MKQTILSTAEVANLFSVTETTVKRWADDGRLRCQRTPGGHRKFLMKHVIEFSDTFGFSPSGTLTPPETEATASSLEIAVLSRDFGKMIDSLIERALSPKPSDLGAFLSYLYQHHLQLWEIFDLVLRPAMERIGNLWEEGTISVGEEHRCSYETLEALAQLKGEVRTKSPNGLAALCASPEGELHEIGLRCIANLLEAEGWLVHYIGARTPLDVIEEMVGNLQPSLVCLSVASKRTSSLPDARIRKLHKITRAGRARLVIGGRRINPDDCGGKVCDAALGSCQDLLSFISREFDMTSKPERKNRRK